MKGAALKALTLGLLFSTVDVSAVKVETKTEAKA